MYELDMGFGNSKLWRGCDITPLGGGRYELKQLDSALKFLESNLKEILEEIPEKDRDHLTITGGVPQEVSTTVTRVFASAFKKLIVVNPKKGTKIEIPSSPADQESAPD